MKVRFLIQYDTLIDRSVHASYIDADYCNLRCGKGVKMPSYSLPDWVIGLIAIVLAAIVVVLFNLRARRPRISSTDLPDRLISARRNELATLAGELGYSFETNGSYEDALKESSKRAWASMYPAFVTMWHRLKGSLDSNECVIYEVMEFTAGDGLLSTKTHLMVTTNVTFSSLLLTPVGMKPGMCSNVELGHEFGRHFRAMCDDEQSMRLLLDNGLEALLRDNPTWRVEFFDQSIRIDRGGKLSIDEIKEGMSFLSRLMVIMPSQSVPTNP